jgi:hypothetical protein
MVEREAIIMISARLQDFEGSQPLRAMASQAHPMSARGAFTIGGNGISAVGSELWEHLREGFDVAASYVGDASKAVAARLAKGVGSHWVLVAAALGAVGAIVISVGVLRPADAAGGA